MSTATAITSDRSADSRAALPMVSVIIPVRNDARRLDRCLASLAEQDYPADRYEVIVIDNGSSDDSADVARRRAARVLVLPGLKVGALRNRGAAIAEGEILALVDSDHEVPPGWLSAGTGELVGTLDVSMIGSPYLPPPDGTWVQRVWALHRLRQSARVEVPWLASGNLFLRKTDYDRLGGFDESLVAAEDVDLCVRLARSGGRIVSDPKIANIHHGEPATLGQFCRKEFWRGSSGLRAFFAHGMPLHELPSLVYPLYHLVALLAVVAAVAALAAGVSWLWLAAAMILLTLPAVLMGIKTALQVGRPLATPALAALYFAYGLVRAAALFKP